MRLAITAVALLGASFAIASEASDLPVFEGKTTLVRPEGYREWVFAGSSLGLAYNAPTARTPNTSNDVYHNVYITPRAYREYVKSGKFPEGTMMALELFSKETKNEPGLQGSYEKDFIALEVSVKDKARFEGGWGYYGFSDKGTLKPKADPFPQSSCFACHDQKAATDHVFTQFYPTLRR